jgi:soluble lytic murein transglycosylase-like protein
MTLRPLGPQAILARMQELKAEPAPTASTSAPFEMGPSSPLAGKIATSGSTAPMSPFGGSLGVTPSIGADQLKSLVQRAAQEQNLDPDLLDALVQTESAYNPLARSSKNAVGLCQLMPDTARGLGVTDPLDPAQNVRAGAKYLSSLMSKFNGDVSKALAAYNAGPGAVEKFGGVPPYEETKNYVAKIMSIYQARKAR